MPMITDVGHKWLLNKYAKIYLKKIANQPFIVGNICTTAVLKTSLNIYENCNFGSVLLYSGTKRQGKNSHSLLCEYFLQKSAG